MALKIRTLGLTGDLSGKDKKIGMRTKIAQFVLFLNLNSANVWAEGIMDGREPGLKSDKSIVRTLGENEYGAFGLVSHPPANFERAGNSLGEGAKANSLNFAFNSDKNFPHEEKSEGGFKNIQPMSSEEKRGKEMFAFADGQDFAQKNNANSLSLEGLRSIIINVAKEMMTRYVGQRLAEDYARNLLEGREVKIDGDRGKVDFYKQLFERVAETCERNYGVKIEVVFDKENNVVVVRKLPEQGTRERANEFVPQKPAEVPVREDAKKPAFARTEGGKIELISQNAEFANEAIAFAGNFGMAEQMYQMALLLNDKRCEWSNGQKKQFMEYVAALAFLVPEGERAQFLSKNLASGGNSLISNLATWDASGANEYMRMIYIKASGDFNSGPEEMRKNLLDVQKLQELQRKVDESPLLEQVGEEYGESLRQKTIERIALSQFLLYAAPALAYNDRRIENLEFMLDRLAEMDDDLLSKIGTGSSSQEKYAAGIIGVKNFYAAVISSFAYAAGYEGILKDRIVDVVDFLSENGHRLDKLRLRDLLEIQASQGRFVPLGRQEVLDTPDGYLALDLMRAANVSYVAQITSRIPNFDVRPSADVVSRPWVLAMRGQQDPNKLYKYFGFSVRFEEIKDSQGNVQDVNVQLVDHEGNPVQIDITRSPIEARLGKVMPAETIRVLGPGGEELEQESQSPDGKLMELAVKAAAANAYGYGRKTEREDYSHETVRLNGNWNIVASSEESKDYRYGQSMASATGYANYNTWETESGGNKTGGGRGEWYNTFRTSGIWDEQYNTWWQLGATQWENEREKSTFQSGFDRISNENRRVGAYFGEIEGEGYYRRGDVLLNPFSFRGMRQQYFDWLHQAGIGEKLFGERDGSKINAALDFGDRENYRITSGAYHRDYRLGGFMSPTRNFNTADPLHEFENYFALASFRRFDLSHALSLGNVREAEWRDQFQARYGISDVGKWGGELNILHNNKNGKFGEILRGYATLGKLSRIEGVQTYVEDYGSGLNIKYESPGFTAQGAGYTSNLEYGNTNSRMLGNKTFERTQQKDWDAYKAYLRARFEGVEIQASGAAHPRFNRGALTFAFADGKYVGAFVDERKDMNNTRGNNTAWGAGFGGGMGLGRGWEWSGIGVRNDPYGTDIYSQQNNYYGSLTTPMGTVPGLNRLKPGAFGTSTEFRYGNKFALRGGLKIFHKYDEPLVEVGAYYQATPYQQLQITLNQTPFDKRIGAALVATGYGFEASEWFVPNGLGASYSAILSKGDEYFVGKAETYFNLTRDSKLYGLHGNIQAPDYSAIRYMFGVQWMYGLGYGTGYLFGEFEKWKIETGGNKQTDWRVNVGVRIGFR